MQVDCWMNAKEEGDSRADSVKLFGAVAILLLSIVAFYQFPDAHQFLRVSGIFMSAIIAGLIALRTERGKAIWAFAQESRVEVRKVVWPTRAETIQTTMIVIVMVIIVAIMLSIIDGILHWAIGLLTGQGG